MTPADQPRLALPRPARLARRVALRLSEAVLVPLGLFYAIDELVGLWPALAASFGWAALAIVVHLMRGGRPSTLLAVTAGLAAMQIGLTAWVELSVLFYLQPTLAAFGFALALLVTAGRRTPLIERLAADFLPMPVEFLRQPAVRTFFGRLSYLWAGVLALNATATMLCLLNTSTTLAVPLALAASLPFFVLGVVLSYRWFTVAVQRTGSVLSWGGS